MIRRLTVVGFMLAVWLAGGAAFAADLSIRAFAGHFVGSGIAKNEFSDYFGMTVRDMDVRITTDGVSFTVNWTTVLRQGGDPGNPDVRRKSSTLSFVPTNKYNVFRSATGGDPLAGVPLTWARISGNTLTVHSLVVDDDGTYNMLTYDRTLSGAGMALTFTRVRDGEPVRTVDGKLIKIGD